MNLDHTNIKTLGELKSAGYTSKSIKDELRENLLEKIPKKEQVFEGVWGYENSVIPELERAILSRHNINLLGLRGQAKTRLARLMVQLLDEWMPIVEGSEIHDDPLEPISRYATELIKEKGDDTPVSWIHRSERFYEKLATPDVTVADLIGDVDPIKAANLKLSYADDRVIHFGMIPRANRCIFVINELPDLQARIQVALFNILEEGDIQIRGFKVRLPLDIQFVFTANPEDYTNRGSIITPLKDRIDSQIHTHYPLVLSQAMQITEQESWKDRDLEVHIPSFLRRVVDEVVFLARESEFVDHASGVRARASISAYENLISNVERRVAEHGPDAATVRVCDLDSMIPALVGKMELAYEGEQEGAVTICRNLIGKAVQRAFVDVFPDPTARSGRRERTALDDDTSSHGSELDTSIYG